MATSRLKLYNAALAEFGERRLSDLSEDREPRHRLDEIWNRGDGFIRFAMEQGLWNFATRTVQIEASTSVTPAFGYTYAFDVPSDYVRLVQMSADEYFSDPLLEYEREGDYFYSEVDPLYVRYVSDGASWGGDLSKWTPSLDRWAGLYLAGELAPGLTSTGLSDHQNMLTLEKRIKRALSSAKSKDGSEEPTRFAPLSSWNRSRFGARYSSRDRGSRRVING